jgi:hypothetical protein
MPKKSRKYWSARVMRESNALDLEQGVFTLNDPKEIALSLKRSADRSERRKAEPFRSAMSMLNFYINRAGKNMPKKRLAVLERAKDELRIAYGREPKGIKRSAASPRARTRSTRSTRSKARSSR